MTFTDVRNIVVLTGAGISAESGLATFRGADGLWEGHRVEDVATPQAYQRDPALVHQFYDARRARLATAGCLGHSGRRHRASRLLIDLRNASACAHVAR